MEAIVRIFISFDLRLLFPGSGKVPRNLLVAPSRQLAASWRDEPPDNEVNEAASSFAPFSLFHFLTAIFLSAIPTFLQDNSRCIWWPQHHLIIGVCHFRDSLALVNVRTKRESPTMGTAMQCRLPAYHSGWVVLLILLICNLHAATANARLVDCKTRVALVTLAHEGNMNTILDSIQQVEETFNHQCQRDTVLFSIEPLTEDFKQLAANITRGACVFETIGVHLWKTDRWSRIETESTGGLAHELIIPPASASFSTLHGLPAWSSISLKGSKRLQQYQWCWKINPQVRRYYVNISLLFVDVETGHNRQTSTPTCTLKHSRFHPLISVLA